MIQRSTPIASAKQLQPELDLPQSGSEDEDETWLTEFTGIKNTTTEAVSESDTPADKHLNSMAAFHQHSKTQPVAEPNLPRTKCDLPGPQYQDDDEDSSPFIQDLNLADPVPCSTRDMTTSAHDESTLTHSQGACALGSEIRNSENAKLTNSDRKATPSVPQKMPN